MILKEQILSRILIIRSKKVMLDRDLAELYGVTTKRLNEQVKRNISRFPDDFMFQLTEKEKKEVVANCDHLQELKFSPYLPKAFSEHGAVMLASVLNSKRAISVNIQIVRVFNHLRNIVESHSEILKKLEQLERKGFEHDEKITLIFKYLEEFNNSRQEQIEFDQRKRIGYKND